jgi:AAA family ATP:ADP antiporter
VSRIFKYAGVRIAIFILPVLALGGYSLVAFLPIFAVVSWAKVLENSADYSIQNTTRHALFLPTSREAKYKAKQATDSFFVRAGDLLQAVVVFVGSALAFGMQHYAMLNIVVIALWLLVAAGIAREYRKLTSERPVEQAA